MKLIRDVGVARRAAKTYFQSDPLVWLSIDMNQNRCPICMPLDRTSGLIGVRYPDAYIFSSF